MTRDDRKRVHPAIPRLVQERKVGRLDRREFFLTTMLAALSAHTVGGQRACGFDMQVASAYDCVRRCLA